MAGMYGMAERRPRGVTVYLLPGLAVCQRRAVIRRLRQEASRGFGPPLPQPQLAIALGLDRVRTTARTVKAVVRLHPAVTLLPGAFAVAIMMLFVIAASDRAGVVPGPRGGIADAAAVSGGASQAASGTGIGAGGHALAHGVHRTRLDSTVPAGTSIQQGPWYTCPQVVTAAAPRPRGAQLACHRAGPWAVPHTAHLPGPLDFAW